MTKNSRFLQSIWFMLIASIGGFLLSLTGLGIGWMIGTIVLAAFLSFRQPSWIRESRSPKGLPPYWLQIGQSILAIEMGQQLNATILYIFSDNWLTISLMLLLSIGFSLLSGLVLWRFTGTDMMTSFFATAPGGVATMPGIAEEVGANTAVVSIVQTIRIFLVVLTIPLIASSWLTPSEELSTNITSTGGASEFGLIPLFGTVILALTSWAGSYVGKFLRLPAPWLVGGMLCVAILQTSYSYITGHNISSYWPHSIIILAQIFIAASVGSRFQREMFIRIKKIVVVALLSTVGLVASMFGCAYIVSKITGISLITSVLAFAPGGVAEMAATSVVLNADSTFVVTVQVLRIVFILIVMPPLFKWFNFIQQKFSTSESGG